ncbi:MAG: GNAT family N-acetyltransferase [Chloroflexota bacterium]
MAPLDTSTLRIIRYGPDQVQALHEIITECGEDLKRRFGLIHWAPPQPLEHLRREAYESNVYGIHRQNGHGEEVLGTFTVGTNGWTYDEKLWADARHRPLYLGKLAIRPEHQGQGLGKWCVWKVEEFAHAWKCQVVRFDAFAQHTHLIRFYQNQGYTVRGTRPVIDWRGLEWEVVYFEKVLE